MPASSYQQYDTVFIILRAIDPASGTRTPENAVALVKALWTQAAAEAEVVRLNQGNPEQGSLYFWKATRLERHPAPALTR